MGEKRYLNDFGKNERAKQRSFAEFRTKISAPALKALMTMGITPCQLTLLGTLVGIAAAISAVWGSPWAIVWFAFYVSLDALDGSLARETSTESNTGAFFDIIADHTALVVIGVFAHQVAFAEPLPLSLYVATYVLMIVILTFANSKGAESNVVVRTKYPFYFLCSLTPFGWIPVQAFTIVLWMFTTINMIVLGAGVIRLANTAPKLPYRTSAIPIVILITALAVMFWLSVSG